MKNCEEIEKDILSLKKKIQQDKLTEYVLLELFKFEKCVITNSLEKCKNCNCWKNVKDTDIK